MRAQGTDEESALAAADQEHRGGSNRLLTKDEDREWATIVGAAADAGDCMGGEACLELARHLCSAYTRYPLRSHPRPVFNRCWVSRHLRNHHLAFGRAQYRDNQRGPNPVLVAKFIADSAKLVRRVGRRRIFCLDEISWRVVNPPRLVVGRIGQRRRVRALGDVRHAFTATFIVNAAGKKLKVVVVKDAQPNSLMMLERRRYGKYAHFVANPGGWTTGAVMVDIITNVIAPALHGHQGVLVMDVASCHSTAVVTECLEHHNIIPLWVPPRGTPLFSPLDVAVMGPVRAKARRLWREHRNNAGGDHGPALSKFFAVGHLIQAFREIKSSTIIEGFARGMHLPTFPSPPSDSFVVALERVMVSTRQRLRVVHLMPRRLKLTLSPTADCPLKPILRCKRYAAPERERSDVKRQKHA